MPLQLLPQDQHQARQTVSCRQILEQKRTFKDKSNSDASAARPINVIL